MDDKLDRLLHMVPPTVTPREEVLATGMPGPVFGVVLMSACCWAGKGEPRLFVEGAGLEARRWVRLLLWQSASAERRADSRPNLCNRDGVGGPLLRMHIGFLLRMHLGFRV